MPRTTRPCRADFLMEQMAWREALEEASSEVELDALNDRVESRPATRLCSASSNCWTKKTTPKAASQQVRALMFIERFGHDIENRFEQLGQ